MIGNKKQTLHKKWESFELLIKTTLELFSVICICKRLHFSYFLFTAISWVGACSYANVNEHLENHFVPSLSCGLLFRKIRKWKVICSAHVGSISLKFRPVYLNHMNLLHWIFWHTEIFSFRIMLSLNSWQHCTNSNHDYIPSCNHIFSKKVFHGSMAKDDL